MPAIYLDVDTALAEVSINIAALIDDTDFKTREESVVFDQSGLDLLWNFVTSAGAFTQTAVTPTDTGGDYDWINQGNGMYTIEIPASGGASINNDTEGYGWFSGFATGILPWIGPVIGFRAAALNDALTDGGDLLDVSVVDVAGTAQTAGDLAALIVTADTAIDAVKTETALIILDTVEIGTAGVGLSNIPLPATGLDLILKSSTFALAIADAIWDEILTGATHNVTNSAGKRLRQIDASFVVDSGTAQAGGVDTITLAAGSSSVNDIYRGDRVIIVGGTGIGEHEIIKSYNGTTKVATMNESWVVQPDATSEYDLTPATVDIGTWKHESVTVSATTLLPEVDAKSISDNAAAADSVQANIGNLDAAVSAIPTTMVGTDNAALASVCTEVRLATLTDWINGGRLDLLIDAIKVSTDAGGAGPWTTGSGTGLTPLTSGTAQSGTASTLVLAASAAFADNVLNGGVIIIHTGTGAGQHRIITSNTLSDDTVNVTPNWTTNPSSDSQYEIWPGSVNVSAVSNVAEDLPTATALGTVDTVVDAIKVVTDALPNSGALNDLATILNDTANMQPKFVGITLLSEWLGAIAGKQVSDATAQTEMRASGAGSGTYLATSDSQEAMITSLGLILEDTGTTLPSTLSVIQTVTDNLSLLALMWGAMDSQINVASATSTTIVFDTASMIGVDGYYQGMIVVVYGGTGAGQARYIKAYVGATKTATVSPAWGITPDATSDIIVMPGPGKPDVGTTTTNTDMVTEPPTAVENRQEMDSNSTKLATIATDTTTDIPADLLDKLGAVNEAAAAGDPSATESVMQYVKQIVNMLAGATGIVSMPSASAPANNVSIAEMVRAIYNDTTNIGTPSADLAADIAAVKVDTAATLVDTAQMNLGIVVSTTKAGTLTTSSSSTNLTEITDDHFIGRIITFTDGVLAGQSSDITNYVGVNGVLTYTAMTEVAGVGDAFKLT